MALQHRLGAGYGNVMKRPLMLIIPLVSLSMILLVAVPASAPPAFASSLAFHKYSIALETNHTQLTGTQNTRVDKHVVVANTGCSAYYSGNPIYQTQWVLITDDAQNWVEFGTGHQCSNNKVYWFMGYGYNGSWYPTKQVDNPTLNVTRSFKIKRTEGDRWNFYIGGTLQNYFYWARSGEQVHSGIESYDQNGALTSYTHSALQYTRIEGPWTNWQSRDGQSVGTPEMCGGWNSDTTWRMSQNRSC